MTTDDHDPVTTGIKEWQKVKDAAAEALARATQAEKEMEYLRGQNELLNEQKERDNDTIRRLQQQVDEMNLMVNALGAAVVDIVHKGKQGMFRKAGTFENGGHRDKPAAINSPELENNLRDLASKIVKVPTTARKEGN
jgi:predicted nuclease with TOPRIM domain